MSFLEQLQRKPEAKRRQIAFVTALMSVLLIVLVWVVTFNARSEKETTFTIIERNAASPLASFRDGVLNVVSSVEDFFTGVEAYKNNGSDTPF